MSQPETPEAIRQLARETEATIEAIVTQFSGIGSDVDVMREEVREVILAALRQAQQVQREQMARKVEQRLQDRQAHLEAVKSDTQVDVLTRSLFAAQMSELEDVLAALRSQEIPK